MSNSSRFNEIIRQKQKAINKCMTLQAKTEQIDLLIKQLQNLALVKDINNSIDWLTNESSIELDYIRPASFIINRELTKAISDRDEINRNIDSLKDKIKLLNSKLTK